MRPETIEGYLQAVSERIRWKRARRAVTAELRAHLEDQRDDFAAEGRENAERLAVEEMGDPISVGEELDRLHRPHRQLGLLAMTLTLALSGGLLRLWAGLCLAQSVPLYRYRYLPLRNLGSVILGAGVLLASYFLDHRSLLRRARLIYALGLGAGVLSLLLSPRVQYVSYYTQYLVLLYPTVYALWFQRRQNQGLRGLCLSAAGLLPLGAVCAATPSVLGLGLLLSVGFVLLLLAAREDRWGVGRLKGVAVSCVPAVLGIAILAILGSGALRHGFWIALHPELDPQGAGWLALQIRGALSGARWLGPGSAVSSFSELLPNSDSDFLLTAVALRLGWLPLCGLLALSLALFGWLLLRSLRQNCAAVRMTALAVLLTLGLQAALAVTLNLGFVLLSVHFPLVVGNLHAVLDLGLVGLMLSCFRGAALPDDGTPEKRLRIRITYQ